LKREKRGWGMRIKKKRRKYPDWGGRKKNFHFEKKNIFLANGVKVFVLFKIGMALLIQVPYIVNS
jgi:hypothetical protein